MKQTAAKLGRTIKSCRNRLVIMEGKSFMEDGKAFCRSCTRMKPIDQFSTHCRTSKTLVVCIACTTTQTIVSKKKWLLYLKSSYSNNLPQRENTPAAIIRSAARSSIVLHDQKLIQRAIEKGLPAPVPTPKLDDVHEIFMKAYALSEEQCFYCEGSVYWDITRKNTMDKASIEHVRADLCTLDAKQIIVIACLGCNWQLVEI